MQNQARDESSPVVVRYVCTLQDPSMLTSTGADEAALEISYSVAPPINIATAEQLLLEVKQTLDQFEIPFFLRQGTCLGIIRDNALIPWDDDIDVGSIYGRNGVTEEKIEAVANAFRANGYFLKIENTDHCAGITMMKSSTRIDWNCYKIIDGMTVHYPGVHIPASYFQDLNEIDFIGEKFFTPNPVEEYLQSKYGAEWLVPKKNGFEKDVLALIQDAPLSESHHLPENTGKLMVLDHGGEPVSDANVRIAAVGSYRTSQLGYAEFHLPKDDWYALVIQHGSHEEVLYQERLSLGQTYIYKPDPSAASGRLCALSPE